jgi:hypothetical protein
MRCKVYSQGIFTSNVSLKWSKTMRILSGSKFPNRPKVHDGKCWWRCYTEYCVVRYYEPEHMLVELRGTGKTISYEELWRLFEM